MAKVESKFQKELIDELKTIFPGCKVVKNDPNYIQGFPDLTVYYKKHWALLECKRDQYAPHQPNQDYYIDWAQRNSYGSFVYPENKEEVIRELREAFGA